MTPKSCNDKAIQNRTLSRWFKMKNLEILIQWQFILILRGVNGMFIYTCDDELRRH